MWRAFKVRGLHPLRRTFPDPSPMRASMPVSPAPPYNPAMHRCTAVWAPPLSLAATQGISFDFLSCRYLDGSLPCVSLRRAMCSPAGGSHPDHRVTPFGHLRIVGRWHLPAAFRSYPRPSSSGSSFSLEAQGLEPWTLGLQSRCSSQLSHAPMPHEQMERERDEARGFVAGASPAGATLLLCRHRL